MSGPRVVELSCGHQRWAPYDWPGIDSAVRLDCSTCGAKNQKVIATTPDLDSLMADRERALRGLPTEWSDS